MYNPLWNETELDPPYCETLGRCLVHENSHATVIGGTLSRN